jgi:simple sugar transport system ATP-binding protein
MTGIAGSGGGATQAAATVVLRAEGLSKSYGAIEAVRDVDLTIGRAEIVAIVGDNGAGKTSLVKILAGALAPDRGRIEVDGVEHTFDSVLQARRAGIEMVYQDLALVGPLDVTANFLLGREVVRSGPLGRLGFLDRRRMRSIVELELAALNVRIPKVSGQPVAKLSGGQRQAIAVARAIHWASKVLILDEPTAALGVAQAQSVLDLVKKARDAGTSVVIISHILPHVIALADRVIVMRHGRKVAELAAGEVRSQERLIAMIVGFEEGAPSGAPEPSVAVGAEAARPD